MSEAKIYPPPNTWALNAHISFDQYQKIYEYSIHNNEKFWHEQAQQFVTWFKPWEKVLQGDFNNLDIKWFVGGKLNACYNCLDRHLPHRAQQTAIVWEGDNPKNSRTITYAELHQEVCRFANILKKNGIKKGDRVCIYLPMIPEAIMAMLACARIGAVHSVVFGGFSAESLKIRILDADCKLVITADGGVRGNKRIPLKVNVDQALRSCPQVERVIVIHHNGDEIPWNNERDRWYHELIKTVKSDNNECEVMDSQDSLFILYTSGSTGKPKGILHGTGGYLVYSAITYKYIFNYQENDVYWCTADVGWITGHTYVVYGPLLNGATLVIFEGVPHFPSPARFWQIIDKYQVNIFYTAPTALRALRKEGDTWLKDTKRSSLKLLGTVGEPINPDVWEWYYHQVGQGRCPIVDTWWQTETGGVLISPLPGATPLKPGSASWPFFGIVPAILDEKGKQLPFEQSGKLVITKPWPGMMQTVYKDQERFIATYFKEYSGYYLTGDGAYCDDEGYYWISGRNDDVIKISGHRLGTEEVESALLSNSAVAEAAIVSIPDTIKGEAMFAFVTLKVGVKPSHELKQSLTQQVKEMIGPIAILDNIQWTKALPKTRSGKIMRRILRKIARNELSDLGDLSTLAEPQVVEELIKDSQRQNDSSN